MHPPVTVLRLRLRLCLTLLDRLSSAEISSICLCSGWEEKYSYGYHGDDGKAYNCNGSEGKDFGPIFSTGDVIGCGVNFLDRSCFFTKNGAKIGNCARGLPS